MFGLAPRGSRSFAAKAFTGMVAMGIFAHIHTNINQSRRLSDYSFKLGYSFSLCVGPWFATPAVVAADGAIF